MYKGLVLNKRQYMKFCRKLTCAVGITECNADEEFADISFGDGKYKVKYEPYKPKEITITETDDRRSITFHYGSLSLIRTDTNKIISSCGNKKEIDRFITSCQCAVMFDLLK